MASEIKESQMYTDYLTYDSVPIKSLIAGDNCAITTDGSGAYTVEAQTIALPLFNDTDFIGYGGTWDTSTKYDLTSGFGTSMGGGVWKSSFDGVEFADGGGLPSTAGSVIRVSGTYVEPGYVDTVIYSQTSDEELITDYFVQSTSTEWYVDIDLTSATGNFKKLSYYHNGNMFPFSIETIEIL